MIRKLKAGEYRIYSIKVDPRTGKRRNLGTFATREAAEAQEKDVMAAVDKALGAIARPAKVCFVSLLPKTRSGKLLRRSIQAICEGRDPGDLTTIEDPSALQQIRDAVKGGS